MRNKTLLQSALALGAIASLFVANSASAFCGFYVSGAGEKLFNNATQVVIMRDGMRTVLSMQNNYQGPPSNFAMVVPVPVVLQKENVKTLPKEIFSRVDQLAAPRLVEYWEQDPCYQPEYEGRRERSAPGKARAAAPSPAAEAKDNRVVIEAQFTVGEYEVLVLSAKDAGGLDSWLKDNGYKIPEGSEPYFRPYIESGSKFFVAKVDATKVKFENGMATLSPLRFHYDSDKFNLPIRLGLVNASSAQDLIVHILAKQKRFEVSNYPNVTIPTNLDVTEKTRDNFGPFYAALFDRTLEKNPKAVITEYSWDAGSCDPCPTPALTPSELSTLGADVLSEASDGTTPAAPVPTPVPPGRAVAPGAAPVAPPPMRRPPRPWFNNNFVLTRMHARYTKESLGEDLVFKEAPAIAGGREFMGKGGKLEEGAVPYSINNFQGRYAMRHPWTGPMTCANPVRGRWGGPPSHVQRELSGQTGGAKAATNLAFVKRGGVELASFLQRDVSELDLAGKGGANSGVGPDPLAALTKVPPGMGNTPRKTATTLSPAEPPNPGFLAFFVAPFLFGLLSSLMGKKKP
jgi:hypothetical protein